MRASFMGLALSGAGVKFVTTAATTMAIVVLLLIALQQVTLTACQPTTQLAGDVELIPVKSITDLGINLKIKFDSVDEKTQSRERKAREICNNEETFIGSLDEMLKLIAIINRGDLKCDRYESAIYELDPILKLKRNRLCDETSINEIKSYHFRFIQPFKRSNKKPTQFDPMPMELVKEQLHPEPRKYTIELDQYDQALIAPIAVRHFFLKFALQVSQICKRSMVANLLADVEQILTDEDREMLQLFDKDNVYGQSLGAAFDELDFDSVLYIPELDGKKRGVQGEELRASGQEQRLKTDASRDSALANLVYSCNNRFKPIYDKLIMPVVNISKLGYDYQGKEGFEETERDYLASPLMKTWLVIVHICEIFKKTVLISEEPANDSRRKSLKDALDASHAEARAHGDLDEEEEEVESDRENEGIPVVIDEHEEQRLLTERTIFKFTPINYEPRFRWPIGNELLINNTKQLDVELARKHKDNPLGFRGFLRKTSNVLLKMLAKLDFNRFAHFRRQSVWYAGVLNFLSGCTNIASISLTLKGVVAAVMIAAG